MSEPWRVFHTLGIWLGAAALLGLLGVQCAALVWLAGGVERLPDAQVLFDQWVDARLEAGVGSHTVDPNDPLLERRSIVVTTALNERTARDVVERLLLLDARDPATPIDLYVSTPGGWGSSAFAILDTMRLIRAPVDVWAIGGCHSAGAIVLAGASGRRRAAADALIMIHTNLSDGGGPFSYDSRHRERYERIWRERARLPDDWFPMTDDGMYYLTAEEALRFGVIDEIAKQPAAAGRPATG